MDVFFYTFFTRDGMFMHFLNLCELTMTCVRWKVVCCTFLKQIHVHIVVGHNNTTPQARILGLLSLR